MKIRIRANTVRYRLSKWEVATLASAGSIEEKTEFINSTLIYEIKKGRQSALTADFAESRITLFVPEQLLQQWADTEQVGMEAVMLLPNGNSLHLLLEKDFKCVDLGVKEDQSEFFENPLLAC